MRRIRGRRSVCFLMVCVLPLLANKEHRPVRRLEDCMWETECALTASETFPRLDGMSPWPLSDRTILKETPDGSSCCLSSDVDRRTTQSTEQEDPSSESASEISKAIDTEKVLVDYASKSAGALILEKSASWKGASNLLNSNKDQYAIIPCEEAIKSVSISLSEDILVKQVEIANYERYSSHMKEFRLWGSQTVNDWADLGTYQTLLGKTKQRIDLEQPAWARYLKFQFTSHYGEEHYCTVSQISAYGSTILQGFHEQWNEQEGEEEEATQSVELLAGESRSLDGAIPNEHVESDVQAVTAYDELCYTSLDAVCPIDMSFERAFLLYSTPAASEFDILGVLSSASMCLSSPTSASASLSPAIHVDELNTRGILPSSKEGPSKSTTLSLPSPTSLGGLMESRVVEQFHHIVESKRLHAPKTSPSSELKQLETETKESVTVGVQGQTSIEPAVKPAEVVEKAAPLATGTFSPPSSSELIKDESIMKVEVAQSIPPGSIAASTEEQRRNDETNQALLRLLDRLPSAACLQSLNFDSFKSTKTANKGSAASVQTGGGQGGNMEPIFKKLSDEIKALHASISIHDQYAREVTMCYQSILLELLIESESRREAFDARVSKIEELLEAGLAALDAFHLTHAALVTAGTWVVVILRRIYSSTAILASMLLLAALYALFALGSTRFQIKITKSERSSLSRSPSLRTASQSDGKLSTSGIDAAIESKGVGRPVTPPPARYDFSSAPMNGTLGPRVVSSPDLEKEWPQDRESHTATKACDGGHGRRETVAAGSVG